MIQTMARKHYSEEFRQQAVDLYESTPGATLREIAVDLGIQRGTLAAWVEARGTGKKTTADGRKIDRSVQAVAARRAPSTGGGRRRGREQTGDEGEVARLRARVRELEAEQEKLQVERDILRSAAKFFAQETNW